VSPSAPRWRGDTSRTVDFPAMETVMSPGPRNLRWPLFACLFFVAPGAALVFHGGDRVWGGQTPAKPNEKSSFQGKWDGAYVDDEGKPGKGEYVFREEKDGQFEVSVSWKEKMKPQEMKLKGKRLGLDAMYLEGKHVAKDTTYRYMGRMENGQLVLNWLSIDEKTGQSGKGVSTLTHPK
jgi:hypothetical protein